MTTTAEQCIKYRHERTCHDLVILVIFPARLYVSQSASCCVKPIAVLHLTVDGCASKIAYIHSYNDKRLALAVRK